MNIDFGELEDAVEYASAAEELGGGAFLDTESGSILFDGDGAEDVLPEDLYENEKYLKSFCFKCRENFKDPAPHCFLQRKKVRRCGNKG